MLTSTSVFVVHAILRVDHESYMLVCLAAIILTQAITMDFIALIVSLAVIAIAGIVISVLANKTPVNQVA